MPPCTFSAAPSSTAHTATPCPPRVPRSCTLSGGHSDDGFEVQPARAALQLRGTGDVLCYASHQPVSVSVEGQEAPFSYDADEATLRFELPAGAAASAAKHVTVQF